MSSDSPAAERSIRRVCVYCASSEGNRPDYLDAARALGRGLGEAGFGVVYGGASVGTMAAVADAALAAGAEVTGIIPRGLVDREIAHHGLSDLQVVGSMHERKARMAELADAFAVLPGGFGTFEELFEVVTWAQLGFHRKPILLIDVAGYYTPLCAFLDHAVSEGLLRPEYRPLLTLVPDIDAVIAALR